MSTIRQLDTKIWDDSYISKLNSIETLIFIYLLQNQNTSWCGIYEIQTWKIAAHTKCSAEFVDKTLQRFEDDGKAKYDDGWIVIKNFLKYKQSDLSIPNVRVAVENALKSAPQHLVDWMDWSWLDEDGGKEQVKQYFKGYLRVNKGLGKGLVRVRASTSTSTSTFTSTSTTNVNAEKSAISKKTKKKRRRESVVDSSSPDESFDVDEWLKLLTTDGKRHIRVIGVFLIRKREEYGTPDPKNKNEAEVVLKRHLRAATQVGKFDNDAIENAIVKAFEFVKEETTLDTVLKYLTK